MKARKKMKNKAEKKPALHIITESDDESGLFGQSSAKNQKMGQHQSLSTAGNFKSNLLAPQTLNFSDLSSIMAVEQEEDNLRFAKFEPATGKDCAMAIPISEMLLKEIADKIVV